MIMHWPEIRQVLQKVLTIDIYSCRNRSCILLFWLLNSAQLTRKSGYSNGVAWTMCNSNSKAIVHCRISSLVATCFRNTPPLSQALQTNPLAIPSCTSFPPPRWGLTFLSAVHSQGRSKAAFSRFHEGLAHPMPHAE